MPVIPEEITTAHLQRRWRGYDRTQVETLLRRIGGDYAGALERLATTAEDRARTQMAEQQLRQDLHTAQQSTRASVERARRDVEADAESIRGQAQRSDSLIVSQAEETAAAVNRHAQAMRETAQHDADDARVRLADADRRARDLEESARNRWDELRAELDARFEHLRAAERRFADRIATVEAALSKLRSHVTLLDQVQQVEDILGSLRAETLPRGEHLNPTHHPNGHLGEQ